MKNIVKFFILIFYKPFSTICFIKGEIFIKLDEEIDENWIMLVYLKDNNPTSNIIVEDKTNPTNSQSNEYKPNEIFKFSDALVDSLTSMIDREYKKKLN